MITMELDGFLLLISTIPLWFSPSASRLLYLLTPYSLFICVPVVICSGFWCHLGYFSQFSFVFVILFSLILFCGKTFLPIRIHFFPPVEFTFSFSFLSISSCGRANKLNQTITISRSNFLFHLDSCVSALCWLYMHRARQGNTSSSNMYQYLSYSVNTCSDINISRN